MTDMTHRVAGKREGWVLVLASSLTIVGSVMVAPVLPKMMAEFAPTMPDAPLWVAMALTGPALAIALFAPIAGWLADRYGRVRLLTFGALLYGLLGALPALLDQLMAIVGVRLLFGCAEAIIMTCCTALIADYWSGERRLRYVNRQVIAIAVVGALFFMLGGMLGEHHWRTPFYLYLLPLLLLPFIARILWEPSRARPAEGSSPAAVQGAVSPRPLLVGFFLVCFGMIVTMAMPVNAPGLLVGIGITSSTLIGLASGLGLLSSLVGALLWPLTRRTLGVAGCNALLMALMAVGLLGVVRAPTYNLMLTAMVIHGIGSGMLVPNSMAPVMEALTQRTRGRGMGFYTGFLYIGQFVSPLVISGIAAALSSGTNMAISVLAGLSMLYAFGWLLSALVLRPRHAMQP
ncbi:MFS transporter [Larsenimonas rhizosphaerae]|uniref:MFS transporter n=1 Tax=Larsenimonas rhizosphaerae TaxID=2944682 RepID=A0AA41ZQ88_9GAMM|nr:MFS transporter [Larsenimonas rhizosphaerae]MCX2525315.1 MFS transporter [Larsenimonas rhizosphaerae]